jgi:hypothetical protein
MLVGCVALFCASQTSLMYAARVSHYRVVDFLLQVSFELSWYIFVSCFPCVLP